VSAYGHAFDIMPPALTADLLVGYVTAPDGNIFDHVQAKVFIYNSLLESDDNDPFCTGAGWGPFTLINCRVNLKNNIGLYGSISLYGGYWAAANAELSTDLGALTFHNTVMESPSSVPEPTASFPVSGYYTVANSNDFVGTFAGSVSEKWRWSHELAVFESNRDNQQHTAR